MIWQDELKKQLERHEGRVNHAYQDHLGFWTIGIGRLIDQRRGGGLSDDEVDYLFSNDVARVEHELRRRLHWFAETPDVIKMALCNMAFQLGVAGLMRFRRMLAAMKHRDWTAASIEALDSNWAKQTPNRAAEIAAMIRSVQR